MSIKENRPNDSPENILLDYHSSRNSSVSNNDLEGPYKKILPRNGEFRKAIPNVFSSKGGVYVPVTGMDLEKFASPKIGKPIEKNFTDGKDVRNIPLGLSKPGNEYKIDSEKDGQDNIVFLSSNNNPNPFPCKDPTNVPGKLYKNPLSDPLPVSHFIRVPQSFNNPLLASSNQLSSSRMVLLAPSAIHVEAGENRTSPSPILIKEYPISKGDNEFGSSELPINGQINNLIALHNQESDDSNADINDVGIGIPLGSKDVEINVYQKDEEIKTSTLSENRQNSDRNTPRQDIRSATSIESSYSIRVYQENYNQNSFMFSSEALSFDQIIKQMISQPYKLCKLWSKPSLFKKFFCCLTSPDNLRYTENQEQNAFILIDIGLKKFDNNNELHRNIFRSYYAKYFNRATFEITPSMWTDLGFTTIEIDKNELNKNGIILSILHFIYMGEKKSDFVIRFIELVRMQAQESFLLIESKLMENTIKNLIAKKLNRVIFSTEDVFVNFFEYQTRILDAWVTSFNRERNLLTATCEAMRLAENEISLKK